MSYWHLSSANFANSFLGFIPIVISMIV